MAGFTHTEEVKLLEAYTGVLAHTTPSNLYLALFFGDPTDTGSITNEVSASEYDRVLLNGKFATVDGATDGISKNTVEIAFSQCSSSWATVSHIAICSGSTKAVADLVMTGQLQIPIPTASGTIVKFTIDDLIIALA